MTDRQRGLTNTDWEFLITSAEARTATDATDRFEAVVCATRHGRLAYRHPAPNAKETPWPPTPYPAGSAAWHAYWNAYVREAGRRGPRP